MDRTDLALLIWPAPEAQAAADWLFQDEPQTPPHNEVVEYSPLTPAQYHADELLAQLEKTVRMYECLRADEGMISRPSLTEDARKLIHKIRNM